MHHPSTNRRALMATTSAVAGVLALLSGCGTTAQAGSSSTAVPTADTTPSSSAASPSPSSAATTAQSAGDRLTLTYDGGILVLDADTLGTVADLPLDGFNRLNSADDGEHVYVTTEGGFRVLATGARGGEAALTDLTFPATTPGHVVRHAGTTALFDDGTGRIQLFPTDALVDGGGTVAALPETRDVESAEAHHGVAVELADGTLLATLGNSETRTGVRALDAAGKEVSRFEQCPSVHGEGVVEGEAVVFGCQDGLLVYSGGSFTKLDSPDEFGRIGNAYVTDDSPVAVVDYKDDPDAEGVELTHLALADTSNTAAGLDVLDLPNGVAYTWRGVGRDSNDDAWILGTDGALHRLDVAAGKLAESYPVIEAWRGPAEWQTAHPALVVDDDIAYVTEPATNSVHRVDLGTGQVLGTVELDVTPKEVALVS
ncbi:hypothetical protein GIS00_19855 [Nakamurella sp. YIM 132087]|uniref:PQQ-binding-like beta-propeller repeat protein n=1 Tax=Nakamurella alba TaxID=2665158 RepID=A0A7K1FPX9_9ACTN|nr:hypothetical protein [Nakamurella alba]MTD16197.1 hypothetical protein [Nakamurella alba]